MKRGVQLIIFIVTLPLLFQHCKSDTSDNNIQFYYYPEKNAYYNPVKREFWYSLNGNKSWSSFNNPTGTEPATLSRKIIINTADTNVYRDNENHRKLYSGKLYNVIPISQVEKQSGVEVSERIGTETKRKQIVVKHQGSKPKNGFGKFISKIFGGRKK